MNYLIPVALEQVKSIKIAKLKYKATVKLLRETLNCNYHDVKKIIKRADQFKCEKNMHTEKKYIIYHHKYVTTQL